MIWMNSVLDHPSYEQWTVNLVKLIRFPLMSGKTFLSPSLPPSLPLSLPLSPPPTPPPSLPQSRMIVLQMLPEIAKREQAFVKVLEGLEGQAVDVRE